MLKQIIYIDNRYIGHYMSNTSAYLEQTAIFEIVFKGDKPYIF